MEVLRSIFENLNDGILNAALQMAGGNVEVAIEYLVNPEILLTLQEALNIQENESDNEIDNQSDNEDHNQNPNQIDIDVNQIQQANPINLDINHQQNPNDGDINQQQNIGVNHQQNPNDGDIDHQEIQEHIHNEIHEDQNNGQINNIQEPAMEVENQNINADLDGNEDQNEDENLNRNLNERQRFIGFFENLIRGLQQDQQQAQIQINRNEHQHQHQHQHPKDTLTQTTPTEGEKAFMSKFDEEIFRKTALQLVNISPSKLRYTSIAIYQNINDPVLANILENNPQSGYWICFFSFTEIDYIWKTIVNSQLASKAFGQIIQFQIEKKSRSLTARQKRKFSVKVFVSDSLNIPEIVRVGTLFYSKLSISKPIYFVPNSSSKKEKTDKEISIPNPQNMVSKTVNMNGLNYVYLVREENEEVHKKTQNNHNKSFKSKIEIIENSQYKLIKKENKKEKKTKNSSITDEFQLLYRDPNSNSKSWLVVQNSFI
ncbi:hypothetical protein M0811_06593 [Anaeramoeba ignava]|uniref:CUE domain-containing protein n=1 Tax=Anaeramoeba ignava TaxID=1746090 RepID=A0A9Q0RCT0_ANAIG|nr:hypothetical protein M0811_06593 [Anaeramoeba ignava]